MATFKEARAAAKRRLVSAGNWAYLTFTDQGRAIEAYQQGAATLQLRLRVDNGIHEVKLSSVEEVGWRLISQVDEESDDDQDSGARYAQFSFVRDESVGG